MWNFESVVFIKMEIGKYELSYLFVIIMKCMLAQNVISSLPQDFFHVAVRNSIFNSNHLFFFLN